MPEKPPAEPTPLPWEVEVDSDWVLIVHRSAAVPFKLVASIGTANKPENLENARRIVEAVRQLAESEGVA